MEGEEHSCRNMDMDSFLVECNEITCLVPTVADECTPLKRTPFSRENLTKVQNFKIE